MRKVWIGILGVLGVLFGSYALGALTTCLFGYAGGFWSVLISDRTLLFMLCYVLLSILFGLCWYHRNYWLLHGKKILEGKERDKYLDANLEQAHFQSKEELAQNFQTVEYCELPRTEIKGIPLRAQETRRGYAITFSPATHALIIGTTGSGKTTGFVDPTIRILAESKTQPSMLISDPKGELYLTHAEVLRKKGYRVQVLDLRNPYHSVRWNPLERAYLNYERMVHLEEEVTLNEEHGSYLFEGVEYIDVLAKDTAVTVRKQQLFDMVYEDLNDITHALCPVQNKNEPMWESGAQSFILAVLLAMLEDLENPKLEMRKEKYNFYALTKVATNTEEDCEQLNKYFKGRSSLSRAVTLSKQVLSSSEKTRASYLSTTFDKLSMFSDQSLCALTSENEMNFAEMAEQPSVLFLQIPDEKETRHALASLLILQAYKELVGKATESPGLTLSRPVYFLLDEFGNLPKIEKLEQMITVGRSRNIWLNLVVQSYAQLAKVYEEKSAEIIKSNCNVKVFIGTTDAKTIEEISKSCGNYSIIQRSSGFQSGHGEEISTNSSVKERPLIYPSELAQLNHAGNMGNAVVTVFGYPPIRSKFTPRYESRYFEHCPAREEFRQGRYFDEKKAFYDIRRRNELVVPDPPLRIRERMSGLGRRAGEFGFREDNQE